MCFALLRALFRWRHNCCASVALAISTSSDLVCAWPVRRAALYIFVLHTWCEEKMCVESRRHARAAWLYFLFSFARPCPLFCFARKCKRREDRHRRTCTTHVRGEFNTGQSLRRNEADLPAYVVLKICEMYIFKERCFATFFRLIFIFPCAYERVPILHSAQRNTCMRGAHEPMA